MLSTASTSILSSSRSTGGTSSTGRFSTPASGSCGTCARRWAPNSASSTAKTDHVHLLVHYPPKLPVSTLVNRLKGVSAHYLRKEFTGRVNRHLMHGHLWSPSYFAASCGGAPLEIIKQYIEQQKRPA